MDEGLVGLSPRPGCDALSLVLNFQGRNSVPSRQTDTGGRAAGMPVDVGEAFLQNAKQG